MNPFISGVARAAIETFPLADPILEIGSYLVPGQEEIANLRGLVGTRPYTGIDFRPGPGVDAVENVECLPRADKSVGTVFAFNVFEHVEKFWLGFQEIERVLADDGLVMVSCPFYFRIHGYPSDYWRFTPAALDSLLSNYPTRIIGWHGPAKRPLHVWGVAAKRDYRGLTEERHELFRTRIRQYSHQKLDWVRTLQYGVGRWLCGRRPFEIFWEAEQFATERHADDGQTAARHAA